MGFYNLPYMYGLLNAAFYYWFANTNVLMYSIFLLNMLWISVSLLLAFKTLDEPGDNKLRFYLFAFSFVLSTYSYSLRPRFSSYRFCFAFSYYWTDTLRKKKIVLAIAICLLTAIIGLVHPVGGFYAVFLLLCMGWSIRQAC